VSRAIALGDWNAIKAAKGVGPKTAQKVVIELKDKAPGVMAMGGSLTQSTGQAEAQVIEPMTSNSAQSEALSALVNLGYAQGDAAGAVAQAAGEGDLDTSALIRAALKLLAPKD
jgi:Holliday junction DNA helicase RuvA